jgi:hypothetical protein
MAAMGFAGMELGVPPLPRKQHCHPVGNVGHVFGRQGNTLHRFGVAWKNRNVLQGP